MNDSCKSRFYGAKTIVFWQFEECPIPDDIISDEVEANISSAIKDMGYYGPVSMRAYGDIYKLQRECCGFLIFYATSETTHDKILVDLRGQAVFRPRESPINLMLIVGDISRHAGLLNAIHSLVAHGNFNIILSQPQNVASGQLYSMALGRPISSSKDGESGKWTSRNEELLTNSVSRNDHIMQYRERMPLDIATARCTDDVCFCFQGCLLSA